MNGSLLNVSDFFKIGIMSIIFLLLFKWVLSSTGLFPSVYSQLPQ